MCLLGFIVVFLSGCNIYLAWADLHDTESLWALFQGPIVEFRLGYPIFYLRASKFYPRHYVSSCNKFKHKWPLVLRMTRHQSVNLPLDLQGHHCWLLKQLLEKQALTWGELCSINPTLPHLYNYSIIKKKKKNGKFLSFVGSFVVTSPRIFLINGYLDFMN